MRNTCTTGTDAVAPLSCSLRNSGLAAHVVASGGRVGADVVLGVQVVTAMVTTDAALAALCLRALPLLVAPMLTVGLISLVTGVVLGLGTNLGLGRYWWVAVKLVLTSVLLVLVLVLLRPGVTGVADAVTRGEIPPDPAGVTSLFGGKDIVVPGGGFVAPLSATLPGVAVVEGTRLRRG